MAGVILGQERFFAPKTLLAPDFSEKDLFPFEIVDFFAPQTGEWMQNAPLTCPTSAAHLLPRFVMRSWIEPGTAKYSERAKFMAPIARQRDCHQKAEEAQKHSTIGRKDTCPVSPVRFVYVHGPGTAYMAPVGVLGGSKIARPENLVPHAAVGTLTLPARRPILDGPSEAGRSHPPCPTLNSDPRPFRHATRRRRPVRWRLRIRRRR